MPSAHLWTPGTGGIVDVTIPPPAVATEWTYTCPATIRLRLLFARFAMQTDLNVGTRRCNFQLRVGGTIRFKTDTLLAHSGNTLQYYSLSPGAPMSTFTVNFECRLNCPDDLVLLPGDILESEITNMKAGDQWNTGYIRFEQWISR